MTASPLLIAVVVPVWNRAGLVVRCLDSVWAQSHAPRQIVVVDDGSTDGSPEAVAAWVAKQGAESSVTLLRQPNRGAAVARNVGLAATGELPFVAFLDSDEVWPPDFLARTAAALNGRPEAVAASVDRLRHDLREDTRTRDDLASLALDPVKWIFRHGGGIGSSTLFRAAIVRAAGGYPEAFPTGHDVVLFCRVALRGPWLHCPGEPVTFLRHHSGKTSQATHLYERYQDHELIWARAYEAVANELGPARLPASFLRRTLAPRWAEAGVAMRQVGRCREASDCFRRALRRRPFWIKAWTGLLRATFLTMATP
jgi:glycosyltransferase involved in cell wall biosynthesis